MEPVPGAEPSRLRVSDEDRHRVAEVLREAAGEGRLDLEELEQRLEATYAAKTYGDLVPLTVDLPAAAQAGPGLPAAPRPSRGRPLPTSPRYASSMAMMSETKRVGAWAVEDGHTAFAFMGSVVLDLREALFETDELVLHANAVMGEVRVLVDAGTTVVVEGSGIMGDFSEQRAKVPFDPDAGGPVVRIRGFALMGGVHVQRRGRPGEGRRHLKGLLH